MSLGKSINNSVWFSLVFALLTVFACKDEPGSGRDPAENGDGDGDGDGDASEEPESCDDLDCGDNATCRMTDEPECVCERGFTLEDGDCVDINECDEGMDACDENASCTNTEGDYECMCDEGFEGDGLVCTAVAECDPEEEDCEVSECPAGQIVDEETEACRCDLSGYWAVRQDITFTVPAQELGGEVFIAESVTKTSLWELFRWDYDGSVIKVQKKGCGADTFPKVESPLYGETYSAGVPFETFDKIDLQDGADIELPADKAVPDSTFATPTEAAVLGIKLDDPLEDRWPATTDDVDDDDWVDTDMDGQPGITFWSAEPACEWEETAEDPKENVCYTPVEQEEIQEGGAPVIQVTARAVCVSVGTRIIAHQEVELDACSRMVGELINEATQARVQGCIQADERHWGEPISCDANTWRSLPDRGLRLCTDEQVLGLDEQDQTQYTTGTFEAVKLGGLSEDDVDCEAVRTRLPAIERD